MMRCLLCFVLLLSTVGVIQGQCAISRTSYVSSSYTPTYTTYTPQATLIVPVATYVSVPFYAAVYAPPAVAVAPAVTAAAAAVAPAAAMPDPMMVVMRELLSEMKASRNEQKEFYGRMMNQPPIAPAAQPQKQPQSATPKVSTEEQAIADAAVAVLKKPLAGPNSYSCSSCHAQGQPTEKSADFHMFNTKGEFLAISEDLAKSMQRKIAKERRCPGAPAALSGPDKATVLRALPQPDAKTSPPAQVPAPPAPAPAPAPPPAPTATQ